MKRPLLLIITLGAALTLVATSCRSVSNSAAPASCPMAAGKETKDHRLPVPLLPHMAAHQLTQMRDHLAAIQEVMTAATAQDFAAVERSAARIGSSEQMSRMCGHMGAGAPGFTEMALGFHRTADTITVAAKAHNTQAIYRAVAATLQTCVSCHSTYRQQIVDEAAWERITQRS
jgi:hypothetical protein